MSTRTSEQRQLAAIMFTDIAGYGTWTQRDEADWLPLLDEHNRLLRAVFAEQGGREIKTTGDGFLVEFASALDAARCAIQIQRCLAERNAAVPVEKKIQVRIGLHLGDVVHRENDVFGDGVNIAERIRPLARPGGICLTQQVVDHVRNRIDAPLIRLGKRELKHVREAQAIYRVALPWEKERLPFVEPLAFRLRRQGRLILSAGLLIALVGMRAWLLRPTGTPLTPSPAPAALQAVAVLPFANMSPSGSDEYLSDGFTEQITDTLAKVTGLQVASRTSAFAFKGKNENIQEVGRQLHVGSVLEGSVRKEGKALRITAQLINISTGYHLWSHTYGFTMDDIFGVQSDVAEKVAEALKGQLLARDRQRIAQKATGNVTAYNLYLKGRYYQDKGTEGDLKKSIHYFDQAIEEQPDYAGAYAGEAISYETLLMNYWSAPPREIMPKAKAAAQEAVQLDESLPEAHSALGGVLDLYDWNGPASEREFRRAIELNPRLPDAYEAYGGYLEERGRFDEAIAQARRAQELAPVSIGARDNLATMLLYARRYGEAIEESRGTPLLDPNDSFAETWMGLAYTLQGQFWRALPRLERAARLNPQSPTIAMLLAYTYGKAGKRAAAQRLLARMEERARHRYVCGFEVATGYLGLGQKRTAMNWLQKAYGEKCECLTMLKAEPMNDPLRSDRRFQAMVKQVGLEN